MKSAGNLSSANTLHSLSLNYATSDHPDGPLNMYQTNIVSRFLNNHRIGSVGLRLTELFMEVISISRYPFLYTTRPFWCGVEVNHTIQNLKDYLNQHCRTPVSGVQYVHGIVSPFVANSQLLPGLWKVCRLALGEHPVSSRLYSLPHVPPPRWYYAVCKQSTALLGQCTVRIADRMAACLT